MKSKTIEGASGEHDHLSRRTFLNITSAAIGLGVLGESFFGNLVYADALTKEQRDKMTPEEIITEMKRGNERFRKGETRARDFLKEQKASAKGQYPAAVVLSCIDS